MEEEIQDWFFIFFLSIKFYKNGLKATEKRIFKILRQKSIQFHGKFLKNHYKPVIKVPVERTFEDEFPRSKPENWSEEIDLTDKNSKPEDIKIKVEASARKVE